MLFKKIIGVRFLFFCLTNSFLYWLFLQQGISVNSTSLGNVLTTTCSSAEAVVPVTTQPLTGTVSDVAPTSSTADSDIHIVVDKQTPSEGTVKSHDSSIHIVVDDKTSSSRVIRTMVNNQNSVLDNQCVVAKNEMFLHLCTVKC